MRRSVGWVLAVGLMAAVRPPAGEAGILINEVLADPAGDANGDGAVHASRDEFVELVNAGVDPVPLAGWSLSDLVQVRHIFAGAESLPGFGFFVVFGGGSPQGFGASAATASSGGLGLNNTGDTVTLRDAGSSVIDAFTYGAEGGMDVSLTRSPDAAGVFALHSAVSSLPFSPGATVDGHSNLPHPEPALEPEPAPEPEQTSAGDHSDGTSTPISSEESTPPDQAPPTNPADDSAVSQPPLGNSEPPAPPVPDAAALEPPPADLPPLFIDPLPETSAFDVGPLPPVDLPGAPEPDSSPVVPEPSSLVLLSCGVLGLSLRRRLRLNA